ncbi:MAG: aminotransferase DegT [Dorea sp.]|jgi:dTDP-4-amino-4,6-dideoxygalactose transaminase|nr:aminotransferase DegT [Dorea sp.]
MYEFNNDNRFAGVKPFAKKIWLSSPTMHGEEQHFVDRAIQENWVSTVGGNIDEVERQVAQRVGRRYAVALSSGTAALHLAVRLAGERLYGASAPGRGALEGRRVFCSDMTFGATVNPVSYEGGECVFLDTGYDDWNLSPEALEQAFRLYPDVRLVVLAHLYGTPSAHMEEIRQMADRHGALIVEDAAESLGASVYAEQEGQGVWRQTGLFGDYSIISFNGNKIITGSSGGMLLTDSRGDANKVRKWSTQAREDAPWYQHEELGYNYRMSNIVAGVVRGQLPYLDVHIASKKEIWERYREGLSDLPVTMNPVPSNVKPNYWLSCMVISPEAMCPQVRSDRETLYRTERGKSCPDEILAVLQWANCEGRPIWKPMHLQPVYRNHPFVTADGMGRGRSNAYIRDGEVRDIGLDIFSRGLCLPSDNKMGKEEQDQVMELIHRCFR